MLQFKKEDYRSWIAVVGIAVLLIEVVFFNPGIIFSTLISGLFVYFGSQRYARTFGKILFWFGLISISLAVITSNTFKFLLIAIIIFAVYQFMKSKKEPQVINPKIIDESPEETILKRKPFFTNSFFGRKETPDHVYEWTDINFQIGIGDTVIDLTNTVLPNGESVISIRNIVGNVKIIVPYELDVTVLHSAVIGETKVFHFTEPRAFNQTISYQTENYQQAVQKLKIVTSMVYGDIEVKRI